MTSQRDKKTDRQTPDFWLPRRRAACDCQETLHAERDHRDKFFISKPFFDPTPSFGIRGPANFGRNAICAVRFAAFMGHHFQHLAPIEVKVCRAVRAFGQHGPATFQRHQCKGSPQRGEKPQNRLLSNYNTIRLRASQVILVVTRKQRSC